jgi:hypothetical protein
MKRQVQFLRMAYWAGAVMDGLMLFPMLIPEIGAAMLGIPDFHPGPEYRYAMGVGTSLMAGWTVLLLWADQKPLERRGVVLVTVFPVILGMIASSLYALTAGLVDAGRTLPMLGIQVFLLVLYLAAYWYSAPRQGQVVQADPS